MKKILLFAFAISMMASVSSYADICVPSDPDFDAADCAANGGTPGTPIGIGGGPGGGGGAASNGVPIDGGLSVMLAVGGALGARRAFSKKKKQEN
jgi:hypothetical protein